MSAAADWPGRLDDYLLDRIGHGDDGKTLYLKVDARSAGAFTAEGLEAFTHGRQGKPFRMSYFQAPEACLEHVDEMNLWANRAYEAVLRAAAGNRQR